MPYHKHRYESCGYHYHNYNTLNFFTASNLPNDAVLIYPDANNKYDLGKNFTLSFWINPPFLRFFMHVYPFGLYSCTKSENLLLNVWRTL